MGRKWVPGPFCLLLGGAVEEVTTCILAWLHGAEKYSRDEQLAGFLDGCIDLLESGGRLAIISFHSLEDRLIKRYMRNLARGDDLPSSLPIRDTELNKKLRIVERAQRASDDEIAINPRARSAILRVAEKI